VVELKAFRFVLFFFFFFGLGISCCLAYMGAPFGFHEMSKLYIITLVLVKK
jgi:hypothetical protein